MFGTQIHPITFLILIAQLCILIVSILFLFRKHPDNKKEKQFVWLTWCFILYNFVSGMLPDITLGYASIQAIALDLVGLNLCVYALYYVYAIFKTKPFNLTFNRFIFYIISIFFIYLLTEQFIESNIERSSFLMIMSMVAVAILLQIFETLYHRKKIDIESLSAYIMLVGVLLMPIVLYLFGPIQLLEQPIVNAGYIPLAFVFIVRQLGIFYTSQRMIDSA